MLPFDMALTFSADEQLPEFPRVCPKLYSTSWPSSKVFASPSKLLKQIYFIFVQ